MMLRRGASVWRYITSPSLGILARFRQKQLYSPRESCFSSTLPIPVAQTPPSKNFSPLVGTRRALSRRLSSSARPSVVRSASVRSSPRLARPPSAGSDLALSQASPRDATPRMASRRLGFSDQVGGKAGKNAPKGGADKVVLKKNLRTMKTVEIGGGTLKGRKAKEPKRQGKKSQ